MKRPLRRLRPSPAAWIPPLATACATVVCLVIWLAVDAQADIDGRARRLEDAAFLRAGCPADLPSTSFVWERDEWSERRRRCLPRDVCWFRCIAEDFGRDVAGGCEHLCDWR